MTAKKTLTAALAALTLTTASLAPTSQAQAGGLGKFIAAGVVGAVVGGALASRSEARPAFQPSYGGGYNSGYSGGYRPVRSYEGGYGCGYRASPVFDEDGRRVGFRRVPAC